MKQIIKIGIVVVWKPNPIRVVFEEIPKISKGILLRTGEHIETLLYIGKYFIHIHHLLIYAGSGLFVGSKSQSGASNLYSSLRENSPNHSKNKNYRQYEEKNLARFHQSLFVNY